MTNLLDETLDFLSDHNKKPKDVCWVGLKNRNIIFPWYHFKKIADKSYNSGYGSQEVFYDLVIVGKDWWLERFEYDGSEGWEFKQRQTKGNKILVETVFY